MRSKNSPEDDAGEAARGILLYLMEHPDAKDTVEGIFKWWLLADAGRWNRESVVKAVEYLSAKGWLIKRPTASADEIYSADPTRLDEIKTFIAGSGNKNPEIC